MVEQAQQLRYIAPRVWAVIGVWIWALPTAFIWGWVGVQTRLGWRLATFEATLTFVGVLLARWAGAHLYDRLVAARRPVVWFMEADRIVRVPVGRNAGALAVLAVPFGVVVGLLANVWGWTLVIPDRWAIFPLALALAAWIYGLGSILLYNHVVVPRYGAVILNFRHQSGMWVLEAIGVRQLRLAVSVLTFGWILAGLLAVGIGGGILLTIVAHHFPAGSFGAEVALFGMALTAFVGFFAAWAIGYWYAWGARLYRWWQGMRGPIGWGEPLVEVTS